MGSRKQVVSRTASGKSEIIHLQKVKFLETRIQVRKRQKATLQRKGQVRRDNYQALGKNRENVAEGGNLCALGLKRERGFDIQGVFWTNYSPSRPRAAHRL